MSRTADFTLSRFPCTTEQEAGKWVRYRTIVCWGCGGIGRFRQTSQTHMPPEPIAKHFRAQGWDVGASSRGDICPKCQAIERVPKIDLATPKEPEMAVAEAPRQSTAQDRRRIRDGLDEHYLEDKGCYAKNFSDKSLAAKLDVPAAWVSELREAMGLGPDRNESRDETARKARELEAEARALKERHLALAADAEALERRAQTLLVNIAYDGAA